MHSVSIHNYLGTKRLIAAAEIDAHDGVVALMLCAAKESGLRGLALPLSGILSFVLTAVQWIAALLVSASLPPQSIGVCSFEPLRAVSIPVIIGCASVILAIDTVAALFVSPSKRRIVVFPFSRLPLRRRAFEAPAIHRSAAGFIISTHPGLLQATRFGIMGFLSVLGGIAAIVKHADCRLTALRIRAAKAGVRSRHEHQAGVGAIIIATVKRLTASFVRVALHWWTLAGDILGRHVTCVVGAVHRVAALFE